MLQANVRQCKKHVVNKTPSNDLNLDERKRIAETIIMVKKPNGQGQRLRVLFDSGCSKTIILKMFTDKKISEIEEIKNKDINELKIILANEATTMLHGKIAAVKAAETAKKTFTSGSFGDDLPVVKIKREKFESGLNIVDLVVESKLLNSKSEVRRMIKNLGIKVNNKTIESDKITVLLSEFNNSVLKLSQGKKKHILIKLTS